MAAPKTTYVWITRHGQTEANVQGRFCGHSETPMTERGRQQAAALRERLRDVKFTAVYTSDFRRAMETAAIVLEGRSVAAAVEPDLREIYYGEWEMQLEREMRHRDPAAYKLMRDEDPAWQPPGGETMPIVRARTFEALKRIGARHPGEHVLVVSHGTAIACMLSEVMAAAQTHTLRIETDNCGLSMVTMRGKRLGLSLLNETAHLAGVPGRRRT